jgi:hypothetical protein
MGKTMSTAGIRIRPSLAELESRPPAASYETVAWLEQFFDEYPAGQAPDPLVYRAWTLACRQLTDAMNQSDPLEQRLADLMRVVLMSHPEWNLEVPDALTDRIWTVRIPPLAYLRAMWNLFWSAIRHPLSETTIDLSTGRVLYRT